MRSKYINYTSSCKRFTENRFSDINFLDDVEILAVRRCFSPNYGDFSLHMHSIDHIATSILKSDVIILLPVVNISSEMDSVSETSISYMTWKF